MSVNDLIVQGAEPLFFLDYFATSHLDVSQAADVICGIAYGCSASGCALIGGETAELPGMYQKGEYDLAGFAVGVVERTRVLPATDAMQAGDVLLGLASDGVHSNGLLACAACGARQWSGLVRSATLRNPTAADCATTCYNRHGCT